MSYKEVKRWDIFRANLDPVVGSEQGKSRPVLVISDNEINELLNTVNVIPVTSRKPGRNIYPNEVLINDDTHGLPNESIILCHQIRTIDKQRLSHKYGQILNPEKQEEVTEALCFQLAVDRNV